MKTFDMPSLGADMEAGTLIEWLVGEGDKVSNGQVIAVVETHKGAIEIEIFEDAEIGHLLVKEGESVPVGTPLARLAGESPVAEDGTTQEPVEDKGQITESADIRSQGSDVDDEASSPGTTEEIDQAPSHDAARTVAATATAASPATDAQQRPVASPAARRRAHELGIDLGSLHGSGPGGAILLGDVKQHAASGDTGTGKQTDTSAGATGQPVGKPGLDMAAMRVAIAAAMSRSKREIPHYYLARDIDLQPATDWLEQHNAEQGPEQRVLMGALLLRATILAAQAVPSLNGQYEDGEFRGGDGVHAGIAVALRGGGLIAPAIMQADGKSLVELMAAMREIVGRTRNGRLKQSEMTRGTITVSSLGDGGADLLYGVIYPPQVALVGFGAPSLKPWIHDGKVQPRTVITATLAADHRVSDGREGARLLSEIESQLMQPEQL